MLLRRPGIRSRRGYSLIEVMVAAGLFATGFAAVLSSVSTYMGVVEHNRRLGDVWRLLQAEATTLRALPDTAPQWNGNGVIVVDRFGTAGAGDFTISRTVEPDQPIPGARRITITASWPERTGTRTATLTIHR
jgi:prepilin-type N-terminal cleavage/methylation domain-containing protein